jgi:hypothetical protein
LIVFFFYIFYIISAFDAILTHIFSNMKNKNNKEGRRSMNITPTRPSNTGATTRRPAGHEINTGQGKA